MDTKEIKLRVSKETKKRLRELKKDFKDVTRVFKSYDDVVNHLINFFEKRAYG